VPGEPTARRSQWSVVHRAEHERPVRPPLLAAATLPSVVCAPCWHRARCTRSLAFYRDVVGWTPASIVEDTAFFDLGGLVLALWPHRELAAEADPDGHLWEDAHNPFWPLGDDGRVVLPSAGSDQAGS
jgi:hypothetical protein